MNVVQMNNRVPEDIKLFLMEQAKKEGRSLNNFLIKHFTELKEQASSKSAKA